MRTPEYREKCSEEIKIKISKTEKGKIVSEESKKKNSLAHIGKKHSAKTKKRMAIVQTGKKHSIEARKKMSIIKQNISDETRKKMSLAAMGNIKGLGRKCSVATRKKISEAQIGEKSHNWKGGISCEPYCEIWMDEEYKQSIRDRDNNECQNPDCRKNCNPKNKLSLHHINYIKKDCNPWNIISLCRGCNVRANKNRKKHAKIYQQIMIKKYGARYE